MKGFRERLLYTNLIENLIPECTFDESSNINDLILINCLGETL